MELCLDDQMVLFPVIFIHFSQMKLHDNVWFSKFLPPSFGICVPIHYQFTANCNENVNEKNLIAGFEQKLHVNRL